MTAQIIDFVSRQSAGLNRNDGRRSRNFEMVVKAIINRARAIQDDAQRDLYFNDVADALRAKAAALREIRAGNVTDEIVGVLRHASDVLNRAY